MQSVQNQWGRAAYLLNAELCLAAIKAGADVNESQAALGGPPLVIAASRGFADVVEVLLAHGGAPDVLGPEQSSPLHEAISIGREDICEMVLTAGADANMFDYYGDSPLMRAAIRQRLDIMTLLIEHGARISDFSTSTKRFTALHYAVCEANEANEANEEACRLLLGLGADPMIRAHDAAEHSFSPFMLAARLGHDNLVQLLFDSGRVDPFAVAPCGSTAASLAERHESTLALVMDLQEKFLASKAELAISGELATFGELDTSAAPRAAPAMGML